MQLSREYIETFYHRQISSWELARENYYLLEKVISRELDFGPFSFTIQYNPERMKSSAAKVDPDSIKKRVCFLCSENRPAEQMKIHFGDNFSILLNPYPIFKTHLTIASEEHREQLITGNFHFMLSLASELKDYAILYNGPESGASAPDHLHFQAGERSFLKIEKDFSSGLITEFVALTSGVEIWKWKNYKRGVVTLKGEDKGSLNDVFTTLYKELSELQPEKAEPMMNIIAYISDNEFIIHIIPRKLHRPFQYFAEGSEKVLLSPGVVDLGGVLITPREEDYFKLNNGLLENILQQVCFSDKEISTLLEKLFL
jgi:galactose-1-phosphate uridylyltransferase